MTHLLTITELNTGHLRCVCGWDQKQYSPITKSEATKELLRHQYNDFVYEWDKTHSISKAPSFSSWKANYRA